MFLCIRMCLCLKPHSPCIVLSTWKPLHSTYKTLYQIYINYFGTTFRIYNEKLMLSYFSCSLTEWSRGVHCSLFYVFPSVCLSVYKFFTLPATFALCKGTVFISGMNMNFLTASILTALWPWPSDPARAWCFKNTSCSKLPLCLQATNYW